jgi:hypothetical protein
MLSYLFGVLVFGGFISIVIYGTINYYKIKSELTKEEIDGLIISIIDNHDHGYLTIEIKNTKDPTKKKYGLPFLASFFEEKKILIGDSVFKASNSEIMNFYKQVNGSYYKCGQVNITE